MIATSAVAATPTPMTAPALSPAPAAAPAEATAAPPMRRTDDAPVFHPAERAVSTWRSQAADSLDLRADQIVALRGAGAVSSMARCVKLNNYWCVKKAGWNGEIAADAEGHVAFASAVEGAAVAALLLKRYYVDFGRKTAVAIISRWAPAQCELTAGGPSRTVGVKSLAANGISGTLRARWLASHSRGFVMPKRGSTGQIRRSLVADHVSRPEATPTIAVGLGESGRTAAPMTLDALLMSTPNAPPSRSMIGSPVKSNLLLGGGWGRGGSLSSCGNDSQRITAYAAAAAAGIKTGPDGDLVLFAPDGAPTENLSTMMSNMARVEIGGRGAKANVIAAGIAEAFRPGRNPDKP